jgi:uncharacterized protein (TIGR00255 family)
MLKSMTAFGRSEKDLDGTGISIEIRAVNHRFRDIVLRLPRPLLPLEEDLRAQIASAISRGRIEVTVQMERRGEQPDAEVELNVPLADAYFKVFEELNERYGLESKAEAGDLCQFKDVILVRPVEADIESLKPGFQEAMDEALDSLDRMRKREGDAIERDFQKRLGIVSQYLDQIEERAPFVVEEYRAKLLDRVSSLTEGMELDENRLAQEVAFFAGKCDITEEIVRIRSHLEQFHKYLRLTEAVGRRLDFLIQEMHREVNTISSKASDSAISSAAVEMKGELEKLKEQIQNVE